MHQIKKRKGFSKKLLIADYVVAAALIVAFFICTYVNGVYTMNTINELIQMGIDVSMISISPPFDLNMFGIILGTWIVQLGVSSGAYYVLIKSERKIELPIWFLNDLPEDIKERVDVNQVIITMLNGRIGE